MDIKYSKIEASTLTRIDGFDKNRKFPVWIHVKHDNRNDLKQFLTDLDVESSLIELCLNPENLNRIHHTNKNVLLNLTLSSTQDIYEPEYLTLLFSNNLLISIVNKNNTTIDSVEKEITEASYKFELKFSHLFYFIVAEVLHTAMDNSIVLRRRVTELSRIIDEDSDLIELEDIVGARRDVGQLISIADDQYHIIGFTPRISWLEVSESFLREWKGLMEAFSSLQNLLDRQENKLDTLHLQYQLLLQEKGNKRLNTLTVVQAIFVPLTLIVGIYGMNFTWMPELGWHYGYFIIMGFMALIVIIELWYFWKKGWFD